MGNILPYFLDKYGRLYDKKARFLSEPSLHGRTECCQGNMRIHSTSIAVSRPPPRYYTPGVGLPLHPSTSTLVMKWSLHTQTASQVKSDRSSNRVGEAPPVRPATYNQRRRIFLPSGNWEDT